MYNKENYQDTPAQLEAITHINGPALVIAGPGSGKTYVLTQRLKYMINNGNIPPDNILVITFTKAAALEMKERTKQLIGESFASIIFGTFHSVFYHILKKSGVTTSNVITSLQKYRFIRTTLDSRMLDISDINETVSGVISDISRYKCQKGLNISSNAHISISFNSNFISKELFPEIYKNYEQYLSDNNLVDFEDMLLETYHLLKNNPQIRSFWTKRFSHILIDEFQDIDRLQFETIKLLLSPEQNLFVVGDDDQSIYSFRGACPDIMLTYESTFPRTHKIILKDNYRSTPEIVNRAQMLICNNNCRFPKEITAVSQNQGSVIILDFDQRENQCSYLVEKLKDSQFTGTTAILHRTNSGCAFISELLSANNIPFTAKDKSANIYLHFISQDILSYIRLSLGNLGRGNFYRIMNKPVRYISRSSLNEPIIDLDKLLDYYKSKKYIQINIHKLKRDIDKLRQLPPYGAILYILKAINYESYLMEYSKEKNINYHDLCEICSELLERARNYKSTADWIHWIESLSDSEKNESSPVSSNICVSTLHSSKGLEYDRVFIVDIADGIIPYCQVKTAEGLEEERRLFYVGMTRAKSELYLCQLHSLHERQRSQSQFIKEIQNNYD